MTGNKTIKERETEKARGKKRYIERRVEELEAEKEIKDFDRGELIQDRESVPVFTPHRSDK